VNLLFYFIDLVTGLVNDWPYKRIDEIDAAAMVAATDALNHRKYPRVAGHRLKWITDVPAIPEA
jgi:hypothetical protein